MHMNMYRPQTHTHTHTNPRNSYKRARGEKSKRERERARAQKGNRRRRGREGHANGKLCRRKTNIESVGVATRVFVCAAAAAAIDEGEKVEGGTRLLAFHPPSSSMPGTDSPTRDTYTTPPYADLPLSLSLLELFFSFALLCHLGRAPAHAGLYQFRERAFFFSLDCEQVVSTGS